MNSKYNVRDYLKHYSPIPLFIMLFKNYFHNSHFILGSVQGTFLKSRNQQPEHRLYFCWFACVCACARVLV